MSRGTFSWLGLLRAPVPKQECSTSRCHLGVQGTAAGVTEQGCRAPNTQIPPFLSQAVLRNRENWKKLGKNWPEHWSKINWAERLHRELKQGCFSCSFTSLSLVFPKVAKYLEVLELIYNIKRTSAVPRKTGIIRLSWNYQVLTQTKRKPRVKICFQEQESSQWVCFVHIWIRTGLWGVKSGWMLFET